MDTIMDYRDLITKEEFKLKFSENYEFKKSI